LIDRGCQPILQAEYMAIAVKCPSCQSSYRVAPDRIGSSATCQSCGQRFTLSMAADETLGGFQAVGVPASAGSSLIRPAAGIHAGASTPDQPRVRIGRYEIRELLGAGAFGTVYRAHDPDLDRDVALKVPQAGALDAPGARERFLREAKAAARLHHPNIVPIHDVGQDGGGVFIVAAFIEGQTLAAALASAQVDRARGVEIAAKLADALHAAHQAGIVHRDVKPANVMLDRRGEPQLMDFGLAQLATASAQLTQQGALMGTPCYMSPEQALGEQSRIGPASDQYSLGVLLYELLCGRLPFEGPPLAVLYQVREKAPDPPRSIDPSIPAALEAICLRAMAKRPEERFADCGQLAEALRQAGDASRPAGRAPIAMGRREPSLSAPPATTIARNPAVKPTVAERWKRLDIKRRVAIGTGLLGCLLLLGVIIIVKTRDGEVRVETNDPNAEVTVAKGHITIKAPGIGNDESSSGDAGAPSSNPRPSPAASTEPPTPAIAPFDAEQAKQHQQAWADHLKRPLELENSIGMQFILIPPGEFQMGAPADDPQALPDEIPQHQVRISQPMYLGVHEVTQEVYEKVTGTNPNFFGKRENLGSDIDTKQWPVEQVGWNEAVDFCQRLTALPAERDAGRTYRLPTEAEWEYACRAGTTTTFTYGNALGSSQANFNGAYQVPRSSTGPWLRRPEIVGKYPPNAFGLHDMLGNVWEWCGDSKRTYDAQPQTDPRGPDNGPRLNRGGGWISSAGECRSSHRRPDNLRPEDRHRSTGLRVVCEVATLTASGVRATTESEVPPVATTQTSPPRTDSFAGATPGQQRDDNGLKMKLCWCPPGEFIMGSTRLYSDTVNNEKPAVRVTLTHGFWLGQNEVTQDQWRQVMGTTPWSGQDSVREGTDFPASYIDGNMSVQFCKQLTETERQAGRLPGDWRYALPTEAQWEYACRAGTDTLYHFGDAAASLGEYAWYEDNTVRNQESFAHQVGRKRPNAWGLHDMAGNVFEWCADWYADQTYARHPDGNAIDPLGAPLGTKRTIRGGAWQFNTGLCRAARRMGVEPTSAGPNSGFRVACVPIAP
jgi:predicted Zn finger-like uncharacterized protein